MYTLYVATIRNLTIMSLCDARIRNISGFYFLLLWTACLRLGGLKSSQMFGLYVEISTRAHSSVSSCGIFGWREIIILLIIQLFHLSLFYRIHNTAILWTDQITLTKTLLPLPDEADDNPASNTDLQEIADHEGEDQEEVGADGVSTEAGWESHFTLFILYYLYILFCTIVHFIKRCNERLICIMYML